MLIILSTGDQYGEVEVVSTTSINICPQTHAVLQYFLAVPGTIIMGI